MTLRIKCFPLRSQGELIPCTNGGGERPNRDNGDATGLVILKSGGSHQILARDHLSGEVEDEGIFERLRQDTYSTKLYMKIKQPIQIKLD